MKKIKEFHICDRCKKELGKDDFIDICCLDYFYDLCKECKKDYDKYEEELKELDGKYGELAKKYQFGKYLPKEELKDSDVK